MKRFWSGVTLADTPEGLSIALDGKPLKLPGAGTLVLPTRPLADAVAREWARAGAETGVFSPADTPLTGLAGTAQGRVRADPGPVRDALAAYGASDVICYFADAPDSLIAQQHRVWDPWLAYAAGPLGAPLLTTVGIGFVVQRPASLAALRAALDGADAYALAALGVVVPLLGSLVLGLALWRGDADAPDVLAAATVDEREQAARWGVDTEARARTLRIARDVEDATAFMSLSRA